MRLSICPRNFQGLNGKRTRVEESMQLCAQAGFTCFDFGVRSHIGSSFVYYDDWEKSANELAESTRSAGYSFIQSHAPYAFQLYNDIDYYRELTYRSFRVASILGAEYIVIHGLFRPDPGSEPDFEEDLERSYEFYAPFVELAEKLGIGVAVENLFNFGKKHIFTADVEEQVALIERFGSDNVFACWDVGHAHVRYGEEHLTHMRKLGSLLSCTHIHDNMQSKDLHIPAFLGEIDWTEFMKTLRRMDYTGDINFELKVCRMPEELLMPYLKYIYRSGECMLSVFQEEEENISERIKVSGTESGI